jgi:hypothetical protein
MVAPELKLLPLRVLRIEEEGEFASGSRQDRVRDILFGVAYPVFRVSGVSAEVLAPDVLIPASTIIDQQSITISDGGALVFGFFFHTLPGGVHDKVLQNLVHNLEKKSRLCTLAIETLPFEGFSMRFMAGVNPVELLLLVFEQEGDCSLRTGDFFLGVVGIACCWQLE